MGAPSFPWLCTSQPLLMPPLRSTGTERVKQNRAVQSWSVRIMIPKVFSLLSGGLRWVHRGGENTTAQRSIACVALGGLGTQVCTLLGGQHKALSILMRFVWVPGSPCISPTGYDWQVKAAGWRFIRCTLPILFQCLRVLGNVYLQSMVKATSPSAHTHQH